MAYDPYRVNPYEMAQYPSYQMPAYDPRPAPEPQKDFTSLMTQTPGFNGGGFQGAQGYTNGPAGQVVDTTGQYDMLGTAGLIGLAMPGGSFTNAFGRIAQSAFGPYGVTGWEDVHLGHPQWGAKMAAIQQAKQMNRIDRGLSDRGRDAVNDRQGHGGGGQLGSDRDTRAGGPR